MYRVKQTVIDLKTKEKSIIYLTKRNGQFITFKSIKAFKSFFLIYLYRFEKSMEKSGVGFVRAYHTFESCRYNTINPDGRKQIVIVSLTGN